LTSCQCEGIELEFSEKEARDMLASYRKNGPGKTTSMLIDALKKHGVDGLELLDIGGGVGAVSLELMKDGVTTATSVDASTAYAAAQRRESERQGVDDRINIHHGNFVDLADQIEQADVVTLDRVICCYDDVDQLVGRSVEKARRFYALVYPRDRWWMKIFESVANFYLAIRRNPFRTFIHATDKVEGIVKKHGFERRSYQQTFLWQVVVFAR
jgi:magnesium-protoporphyrin O-methyltransferase